MGQNYLVTGAAGFIGAAVAAKLIKAGHHVVTIDNLSTGYKQNIPDQAKFIDGSTFDPNVIEQLQGQRFDAIIHIAGQSSGEISFENPVYDLQANAQSTLMLLDYAQKTGCKKFIYASTMCVYGDPDPAECLEETKQLPHSFYAVGKMASEHYMRIYVKQFGLTCTALRLFNIYGEGQNMKNLKQGMISIYLAMAIKDHKITVKGSKDRFRDFVYIDDVVDAFLRSIDREGGYEAMNVCTGQPTTVETVVNTIVHELGEQIEVEYTQGTPGDQFGIYGNNRKILEVLGWEPHVPFDEGIRKMIRWAKETDF